MNGGQNERETKWESHECRQVPCAQIADDYWKTIIWIHPPISHAKIKTHLATDLGVWCHDANLRRFCANWRSAHSQDDRKSDTIQRHWQTALNKQLEVTSVLSYPRRVPVTAPVQIFRYWTCLLSRAVCQTCGRKDTASWRVPKRRDGCWHEISTSGF